MLANKEYKGSGVIWLGLVPKCWNVQRLKNVLVNRNEANEPVKTDFILSLTNDRGVIPYSEKGDVGNKSKDDVTGYKLAYPGDIVLNSMNVIIGSVGLSNYFGAVSPVYYMLYPRNKADEVKYYNYIFQTREFQQSLKGYGNGIMEIRMRIPIGNLNNVMLPVPTPAEQKAIADYLDGECARIDGIVTTQRQIIERLKEYKKSVITEAVTRGLNPDVPMKDSGIEWVGKIPEHWEVRRIKTLGEYRNGLTYNPENMVDESNGTLVLRSSNIQNGKIVLDDNVFVNTIIPEQLLVHKGDIIICSRNGSRELVGKNALIKEDIMASFGAFMMIFRTNYPEYISYILNSAIFSYYLSTFFTATINQLTGSNFGNMQIVFCPDLNEQQEIIDYLDKECARIDTIIEKRERMIELMTEYKKSLIYECVTGKKEIVDVVE